MDPEIQDWHMPLRVLERPGTCLLALPTEKLWRSCPEPILGVRPDRDRERGDRGRCSRVQGINKTTGKSRGSGLAKYKLKVDPE